MIFIKILPLGTPLVETYNYEAYPLAISSAHGNGYLPWLYNNYIQLNCHDDIVKDKELFLAFYDDQAINSPFIKKQFLLHSSFSMLRIDFFDFIRKKWQSKGIFNNEENNIAA